MDNLAIDRAYREFRDYGEAAELLEYGGHYAADRLTKEFELSLGEFAVRMRCDKHEDYATILAFIASAMVEYAVDIEKRTKIVEDED